MDSCECKGVMARHNRAHGPLTSFFVAVMGLCAFLALAAMPARAGSADDVAAQGFIQQNIDHGIDILKNKSLTDAQRREQIHDLLSNLLDTTKIGLFALGSARSTASQADLDDYVTAFKAFMIASYETRLSGYGGQSLKVTSVIDHAPGDYIVSSVLVDPGNPGDPDPVRVDFRVLGETGKFAIVDASIAGVWLGLAQRDDFGGFLGQHNASVPALTAHLKDMTAGFLAQANAATAP